MSSEDIIAVKNAIDKHEYIHDVAEDPGRLSMYNIFLAVAHLLPLLAQFQYV